MSRKRGSGNHGQRMIIRQSTRTGLRRKIYVASSLFVVLATGGLVAYFQFAKVDHALAASSYYSITGGDWSDPATWSTVSNNGAGCNCSPGCSNNKTVFITHSVTVNCAPEQLSGNGTINISGNGKLIFNNGLTLSGSSKFNIASGDSVIVNGNLMISGNSNINVSGYFLVNGDVNIEGNSSVCGTGFMFLTGTLTGSTWCGGVLPIELLYFRAKFNNGQVEFNWATATEINNDYFTIERSQDGNSFVEIFRKPGAGNSTSRLEYSATDNAPVSGTSYYRLKQTDYDGKYEYFPTQSVENKLTGGETSLNIKSVAPNPFSDHFDLRYSVPQPGLVEIMMSSVSGKTILKESAVAGEGLNTFSFQDRQDEPPGIYLVTLVCNGEARSQRIIKK